MARDGSGSFNLPAGQPVVTATVIDSTVFNLFAAEIATALTNSLAKDGQTTPTTNLPMGNFRHTGVADGNARNTYLAVGQFQDAAAIKVGSVAGTDTITGSLSPAITGYVDGMVITFKPANNNTGAATIALNGLTAKNVRKGDGSVALAAGDLKASSTAVAVYDGTQFVLLNPVTNASFQMAAGSAAAPGLPFATDLDTGRYLIGANTIGEAVGGVKVLEIAANKLLIDGTLPGFYLSENDPAGGANSGLWKQQVSDGTLAILTRTDANGAGATLLAAPRTGTTIGGVVLGGTAWTFPAGTVALPGVAIGETDCGIYLEGTDSLAFSCGGTKVWGANATTFNIVANNAQINGVDIRNASILTAGSLADARVQQSNVTQHQDAITSIGDATVDDSAGNPLSIGYRNIPQLSKSANYTFVAADAGKHVFHPASDANARTFTIPANASVGYALGTALTFINRSANNVTIAITSDTMFLAGAGTTGSRTLAQNGMATAVKINSVEWMISGTGLS